MKRIIIACIFTVLLFCINSCKTERAVQEIMDSGAENFNSGDKQPVDQETIEFTVEGITFAVCYCPPGRFVMGSPAEEADRESDEIQHEVSITRGFWMMETEVTQELYEAVAGNNPSHFKGIRKPVEMVTWYEADRFCKRLSELTGRIWELPTEAEWEYACRAGTVTPFHYGSSLDPSMANYDPSYGFGSSTTGDSRKMTMDVKSFRPNQWGLYDMHGNVWEWCSDYYDKYAEGEIADPKGPEKGSKRVIRGGGWYAAAGHLRSANRGSFIPDFRNDNFGFRAVLRPH